MEEFPRIKRLPPYVFNVTGELKLAKLTADVPQDSPTAVSGLARRCLAGTSTSTREDQAFVGALSAQLWFHSFFEAPSVPLPLSIATADVLLTDAAPAALYHA